MTTANSGGSLVRKLSEVMEAVGRIPKNGRNEFHQYDYATEADIVTAIRGELSQRHVMLIPAITGESRHPVGEKGSVLTVLEMEMEFLDGETDERIRKPWRGYGTDKEDKGGYKAMTGGEKYFLLKTFLIPTGDDPEEDEVNPQAKRNAAEPARHPPRREEPPPFEDDGSRRQSSRPVAERAREAVHGNGGSNGGSSGGGGLISEGQDKRLFAIAMGKGWSKPELQAWLKEVWQVDGTKYVPRAKYEAVVEALEQGPPQ